MFSRWVKNNQNRLVCVWDGDIQKVESSAVATGTAPIVGTGADEKEEISRRNHLSLIWVNPKRQGKPIVAPATVINAKRDIGLLVRRDNKYANLLTLRTGPLRLWTVPIETFDADWRVSMRPIQLDVQSLQAQSAQYGADKFAIEALATVQASLEAPCTAIGGILRGRR